MSSDDPIKAALRQAAWADCRATNAGLRCANETPCSACEKEAAAAIEAFLRALGLRGIEWDTGTSRHFRGGEDAIDDFLAAVARAAQEG